MGAGPFTVAVETILNIQVLDRRFYCIVVPVQLLASIILQSTTIAEVGLTNGSWVSTFNRCLYSCLCASASSSASRSCMSRPCHRSILNRWESCVKNNRALCYAYMKLRPFLCIVQLSRHRRADKLRFRVSNPGHQLIYQYIWNLSITSQSVTGQDANGEIQDPDGTCNCQNDITKSAIPK